MASKNADVYCCCSLHEMTCRIIDVFVRHVCLVRPLGEEGKLKITADIAQVGRNHTCMHTLYMYTHTHTHTHTHACTHARTHAHHTFRSCISLVYHSTYVCVCTYVCYCCPTMVLVLQVVCVQMLVPLSLMQFEFALAPLCTHTSVLGVHARMLQGLR